jgi:DNA-binding LytR/AlgR family response regulator
MVYQIGICDDEISTCSELEKILTDYFKISGFDVRINIWYNAEDFMRDVPAKVKVDLLFLDIEMPGKNGINVGEYIREDIKNEAMHIIYVSSKTNYAMELFKVHPYDFMVKPIEQEKVIKNVEKLLELDEQDNRYFVYEYNRIKNKIHYGDIIYFESDGRHIKIICSDGTEKIFVGKMKELADSLPFSYVMVAQSFIINLRHIKMYKKDSCVMDNDRVINIGRKFKNAFNIKMIEYNKCGGVTDDAT